MPSAPEQRFARQALRLALGIAVAYVAAGITWILVSDELVAAVSADARWLQAAQRDKGLAYVLVTGVALLLLVRAGYRRLLAAADGARRALERQDAQFRQLHQSLGEVLWLASPDGGKLLYVSPAFEAIYGRPAADFQHDPTLWLATVHPDDRALAEASRKALVTGGESSCEYRILRPDGTERWISDRKKAIVDEDGRVSMVGGIGEDISARKTLEGAHTLMLAELERRVAERTAALERVNAELDAFARTAAHDMKSPLNAIAGFSQLVQMKHGAQLGEDGLRLVARIDQSARHMATLINDLMALSRVSAVELQPVEVDLAALARELVDELRHQQPERALVFDAPPALPLRCDAGLARSLLANLLGNAWKFSARRSPAHVRLWAEGPRVCLQDDGAGFAAPAGEAAFKPFQRFHPASEFSGTGIGLVTCQRIVQRHGGEINIRSTPGEGTTVCFTLGPAASVHKA